MVFDAHYARHSHCPRTSQHAYVKPKLQDAVLTKLGKAKLTFAEAMSSPAQNVRRRESLIILEKSAR